MKLEYNDEEHAYWLDGRRCKGVTSVAKYPEDTYAIDQWVKRGIVTGLAITPPLVHRATAHFDERDKVQAIAEEALNAARAHEAAGRGIADHRITERVDLGLDWIDTPEHRATVAAWTGALDQAGLEIDTDLVEQIVVYPDQMIAGRYDRIARYRQTGRHVIADVKTGENAIKYPHSTIVQLALYANAPLQAVNLRRRRNNRGDWVEWTDTFAPLPDDLHRDHAVVVYLPPEGPAKCYRANIARGWTEAAKAICFPTIDWRKVPAGDLIEPLGPCLVAPLTTPERHQWIRNRIRAIVTAGHEQELAAIWDTTLVPIPLAADTPLSDQQIDTLVAWCTGIEALAGLPFEPTDPLFVPFVPAVVETPPPAPEPDPAEDEEARRWADKARQVIEENSFDLGDLHAVLTAAHMTGTETMTEALYQRIESLCEQVNAVNGAVIIRFKDTGEMQILSAPDAEERMIAATGSPAEAKARAARIAKQAGHIAPRSLAKAAEIPLLAAMVAAGHGTNTTNKEQPA